MKEPYEAAINGKWEAMIKFFGDRNNNIFYPMTVAKDTVFHLAVLSKEPLKQLLERVENPMLDSVFITNASGNTVLHEAASNNNITAVKLLVGCNYDTQEQLVKRNKLGQTPLFKAASFGTTKVVKYLASRPYQMITYDNKQQLRDEHRTRNNGTSILHAAVRGDHFALLLNLKELCTDVIHCKPIMSIGWTPPVNNGLKFNVDGSVKGKPGTALELLELDEGLANLKTKYGKTSLHLLTTKKSTFRQKHCELWHGILYFCIPTGDDNNDDANNMVEDDDDVKVGDSHSMDSHGRLKIRKG
ncbi:hypothetical protein Q3G72_035333 [Acer saccharum]|nr:hypothetical protein Q3G72_035333 [Acer saccharum]